MMWRGGFVGFSRSLQPHNLSSAFVECGERVSAASSSSYRSRNTSQNRSRKFKSTYPKESVEEMTELRK